MIMCSAIATPVAVQGFEGIDLVYRGKDVAVTLVWTFAAIEPAFTPSTVISHMRYLDDASVIDVDVGHALDFAASGDLVVLLCANEAVCSKVRRFLQPFTRHGYCGGHQVMPAA